MSENFAIKIHRLFANSTFLFELLPKLWMTSSAASAPHCILKVVPTIRADQGAGKKNGKKSKMVYSKCVMKMAVLCVRGTLYPYLLC